MIVFLKNFVTTVFVGVSFCSLLFTCIFANNIVAKSNDATSDKGTIAMDAKNRVNGMYLELQKLAGKGANVKGVESFLKSYFDCYVIAKRFGIEDSLEFQQSLAKFLYWRFKNEAMKTIVSATLGENFAVTEKKESVVVKGSLSSGETAVDVTVIFVKLKNALGKVKEVVVVGIPLIEGITPVISKYCEKQKIRIKELTPDERGKVFKEAIDGFVAAN
jgi:hypothetical protein